MPKFIKKILLHTCCGPCATACIERLRLEGLEPVLYFSNHNIAPHEEYERRLETVSQLAEQMKVDYVEDVPDHDAWLKYVRGLEAEPEKGARCSKCFEYSLKRTFNFAEKNGFRHFTTTLTVSPHKVSRIIFLIGQKFPGFEELNFKKKDGFRRSLELSRSLDLYRQPYCGCEFSLRDMKKLEK